MLKHLLDMKMSDRSSNTLQGRAMKVLCDPGAIMQIIRDFDPDVLRFISEETTVDYRLFESDTTKKILNIVLCSYRKDIYTVNEQIIIKTKFNHLRKYRIGNATDDDTLTMTLGEMRKKLREMIKKLKMNEIVMDELVTHEVGSIGQDYKQKLSEHDLVYPYIAFHRSTLNEFKSYGEACKFMLSRGRSVEFINNTKFHPEQGIYRNVIMPHIIDDNNDLRNARIILRDVISTPDILVQDDQLLLGFGEFGALIRKTFIAAYMLDKTNNVKLYADINMNRENKISSYSMYKFVMKGILTMNHSLFVLKVPTFTGDADEVISSDLKLYFEKKRKISWLQSE